MQKVVACIFEKKGKFLLEKRRDNEDNYADLWTFPMGHARFFETKKHAVKREMFEELNIWIKSKDLIFLGGFIDKDPTSKKDYKFYVYLCKKYSGKITQTYEQEKISWLNFTNIRRKEKNLSEIAKKVIIRLKKHKIRKTKKKG